MYIQIRVTPKSFKTEFIEKMTDGTFKIRLKSAPKKGLANSELINFLAKSLNIAKTDLKIISGQTDRKKLVKIPDNTLIPW